MEVVTRINSEIQSIRNSARLRSQVEPKPKVGHANSATRQPTNTNNAVCKHCGETGHYSAKWANCTEHDPNVTNSKPKRQRTEVSTRVGAAAINDDDLRTLIPNFADNLDEINFIESNQSAMTLLRPRARNNRTAPSPVSRISSIDNVKLPLIKDTYAPNKGEVMVIDSGAYPSYVFNKHLITDFTSMPNSVNTAGRDLSLTTIGEGILNLNGIRIPATVCPTMVMNLISVSSVDITMRII
jgi:hypothetical protein